MPRPRGMRSQLSIPATVLALLTLAACGTESAKGPSSGTTHDADSITTKADVTGIRWTVKTMTVDGKKSSAPPGAHLRITTKGTFGQDGCNGFGSAGATIEGNTLIARPGATTSMGCEKEVADFEQAMRGFFNGRLTMRAADKKLTLTAKNGDSVELASQGPSVPLVGTKWSVNSLVVDKKPSSVPGGKAKQPYLIFGKDGTVRGKLGCNTVTGTAKVTKWDPSIAFGRIATTRRVCPGPEMALERELLKILKGYVRYNQEFNGLTLTAEDRTRVLTATGSTA
ncbi:META domain-containing protein [Streptomyces sp. NPDC020681]|uniref:META domain-containing protein n=1 Tax=Streptomyces sp. NPDC020681 TaxID=3365083 RepID=UPI0037994BD0